jgi:hypothetical protein
MIRLTDYQPSFEEEKEGGKSHLISEEFRETYNSKWSTPFSIDDIADFQVEFESQKFTMGDDCSTIARINNRKTAKPFKVWHMPNENNYNKRIVRVTVST